MVAGAARSWCVARGYITAPAQWIVYVVPVDNVLIVKSVDVMGAVNAASALRGFVTTADRSNYIQFCDLTTNDHGIAGWSGWIVANAGYHVEVFPAVTNVRYWVSGALLYSPAAEPIQPPGPVLRLAAPLELTGTAAP